MTRTRTLRRAGLLAALALTLAACGGGSDADSAADDTATTEAETSTTEAVTTTTEEETTTTEAETATTEAMVEVAMSAELEAFCGLRAQADEIGDPENFFDPESVQSWFEQNLSLMQDGAAIAPDEIADDMATMVASTEGLQAVFEEYGYDIVAIPEAELDAAGAAGEVASDRVSDFVDTNCPEGTVADEVESATDGIEALDPAGLESLLASEEGRDLVIEGFVSTTGLTTDQAGCFLDAMPVEELAALTAQDLAGAPSLFAALASCEIDISTLIPS